MNKETYFKTFNELTDLIERLKAMQKQMEEFYISCDEFSKNEE